MGYINITFNGTIPFLEWKLPNYSGEGPIEEGILSWSGQYISGFDTAFIYGLGEKIENWIWIVCHETLHHILTLFIYGGSVSIDQVEEQEYIIDKILNDNNEEN